MSRLKRYTNNNRIVAKYGVDYLDNHLGGITRSDLVVVGARSGAGKSTLSKIIALSNPQTKIKLFSLENFEDDDYAKEIYFEYRKLSGENIPLVETLTGGNYDKLDNKILAMAEANVEERFSHITIINRQDGFDIDKLKTEMIKSCESGYELLLLDHLDYLDRDDGKQSDNAHISELMKTIREVQSLYKVPVVAISHLRKSNGLHAPVVPNMDEFIGSSNKSKEATVVITFAPDDKTNEEIDNDVLKATWCCVRKSRLVGLDNKVARLYFDTRTGRYQPKPDICVVNYSGTKVGKYIDGELVWNKEEKER